MCKERTGMHAATCARVVLVTLWVGGQTFYVLGHNDVDVDEEMYISKANFLVSKANFYGPVGP